MSSDVATPPESRFQRGVRHLAESLRADVTGPLEHSSLRPLVLWVSLCLFAVGLVARIAPFFNVEGRLLRQFPTEDGYLMLTIARNIALGNGMSTADGTIPTNGTQPLATFLWALCSWMVGGGKVPTVVAVLVAQLLISVITAYAIYRLARRLLPQRESSQGAALLAASGWFASAGVIIHSMNCLESGLYVLILTLVLLMAFRPAAQAASSPDFKHWGRLGVMFGIAFWARNDAVLLCGAVALVHMGWGLPGAPSRFAQRFGELVLAGAVAAVVASPWLIYNYTQFGHVMPISGQSQALDIAFGHNATRVIPTLFVSATVFVPIPTELLANFLVNVAATLLIAAYGVLSWLVVRQSRNDAARLAWRLTAIMTIAFSLFYGLFFGAQHFMSRYFFALSPLYVVAWGYVVFAGAAWLAERSRSLLACASLVFLAMPIALDVRMYARGAKHPHFNVAEWVQNNVPAEAWVGSPQSGTIGYFHGRTINFDGKVNPLSLVARKRHALSEYIVDSKVEYIADWAWTAGNVAIPGSGVVVTMADPLVSKAFEVAFVDPDRNVGVLKRKAPNQ
jgi:Dolichyl-phosphate-mannose-protein mannosyltransferase